MGQPHCMVDNAGCKEAGEKMLDLFVDIRIYKMFSGFLPFYNTSFNLSLEMSDDPKLHFLKDVIKFFLSTDL